MTSMFGGRGTEDGRIVPAFAPGDADGDRRVMTLLGLPGAWLRRFRPPAFRAESSRIGGNRSAARRGRDRSGRPGSAGCASAAGRGVAGALHGVCRLNRAAVVTLLFLTLLAGVATPAYAQTLPAVSFASASQGADEASGTHWGVLWLNKAPTSDITLAYTVGGTATSGSDYAALSGTVSVRAGARTANILVEIIQDTEGEYDETVVLTLVGGAGYQVGSIGTHTLTIAANDMPPPTVSFASASQSAGEGSGTHDVGVTLNKAPTTDITLAYTVDGTATSGSDYTVLSGTVTVPKGATTANFPVTVIDDNAQEGSETVVLTLIDGGAGYRVGSPGTHTLTIVDDETPAVSFTSASQSAGEGSGTRNVGVTLSPAPTTDITLVYTVGGTATPGSDHTALSGTLSVPAGTRTTTIPVTIIDDSAQESSETVVLTLAASKGYQVVSPSTHTLNIVDNDSPIVFFPKPSQTVQEVSGTHNVKIELDRAPTSDITISYRVAGGVGYPTPDSDYVALPGTVTVPRGATTAFIPVTIIDDTETEGQETVALDLTEGAGYRLGWSRHRLHIYANDSQARAYFIGYDLLWYQGDSRIGVRGVPLIEGTGTHNVRVQLSPLPTSDITLEYEVGGTATLGSDFTIANSGTLSVPAGTRIATIPVTVIDDTEGEFDETVVLTLIDGPDYEVWCCAHRISLTIAASDEPRTKTMSFVNGSHVAGEGPGVHDVEVTLNKAPATDITLAYTVGGTATPGSDFTIADSGTVSVPAGTRTATIPVTIIDDTDGEYDETVVLTLIGSAGYQVRSPGTHTLTIAANDTPTMSFASASRIAGEGSGTHDVGVRLNKAPTTDITLAYTVDGTATSGSDYTVLSGTLSVLAGATTATIPVTVIDDSVHESSETVVLTLVDSAGYQAGIPGTHTLTITANDTPAVSFASASQRAGEESGTHDVGVTLNPAPNVDLTIAYTTGGTAVPGSDYTALSGTVAVPRGATTATVPVAIVDDDAREGHKTVVLTLAEGSGYGVGGRGTHTLTIVDDETPAASFASASQSAGEGSGTHDVEVRLDKAPLADIMLAYTVSGTATSGSDYTALSGTVAVPRGATTATIPVTILDDGVQDRGETVVLTLAAGEGYRVGSPGTHTLTIIDDDVQASFASASQSVVEGSGTQNVGITLDRAPTADITLAYTVGGTATPGADFTIANSGTVTVPAGVRTATIPVTIVDDGVADRDETVVLTLAAGEGYRVGSPDTHTMYIDFLPLVSFKDYFKSVEREDSGRHDIRVALTPPPPSPITLAYTVGGTATPGADFTIAGSGTVTVPAGAATATIPVTIIDDTHEDSRETIVLTLVGGPGYRVVDKGDDPWGYTRVLGEALESSHILDCQPRCRRPRGAGAGAARRDGCFRRQRVREPLAPCAGGGAGRGPAERSCAADRGRCAGAGH